MLETGGAKQLSEWMDYYELEPWGDEWNRESRSTSAIINEIKLSVPRETPLEESELLDDDAFVPKVRKEKTVAKKQTMQAGFAKMRQSIGV